MKWFKEIIQVETRGKDLYPITDLVQNIDPDSHEEAVCGIDVFEESQMAHKRYCYAEQCSAAGAFNCFCRAYPGAQQVRTQSPSG